VATGFRESRSTANEDGRVSDVGRRKELRIDDAFALRPRSGGRRRWRARPAAPVVHCGGACLFGIRAKVQPPDPGYRNSFDLNRLCSKSSGHVRGAACDAGAASRR